ncbi:MAG: hypothetical protein IT366_20230 [Candidatus Hydrogenedentes bacterium]|nr:hypothetical protein [Candidatus Hydrogenedentota bacterium]
MNSFVFAYATDLVGRNGQFTVKDSKGAVETVDSKQLEMQKELMPSAPRAKIEDAGDTASGSGSAEAKPTAKKATAPAAKPAAPRPETPEEKATRAADVETLRAMRKEGGAYFYTEDNQPIPFDEIDRRIESGEVEGIKAVGLHLQEWKPETKKKSTTAETAAESAPAPAASSAPETSTKAKKKY